MSIEKDRRGRFRNRQRSEMMIMDVLCNHHRLRKVNLKNNKIIPDSSQTNYISIRLFQQTLREKQNNLLHIREVNRVRDR